MVSELVKALKGTLRNKEKNKTGLLSYKTREQRYRLIRKLEKQCNAGIPDIENELHLCILHLDDYLGLSLDNVPLICQKNVAIDSYLFFITSIGSLVGLIDKRIFDRPFQMSA